MLGLVSLDFRAEIKKGSKVPIASKKYDVRVYLRDTHVLASYRRKWPLPLKQHRHEAYFQSAT